MTYIFYHRRDMDGFTSGAIARHYLKSKGVPFKEIPFDYYDEFPEDELEPGSTLIFMDVVCQPYAKMAEINEKFKLVVIDHHKTFINRPEVQGFLGLRSTEQSGCMLTWKYFYNDKPMPKLVYYLGKFDIWDRSNWEDWNEKCVPANFGSLGQNVHPSIKRPGVPIDNFLDTYLNDYFSGNEERQEEVDRVIAVGQQIWTYMYLEYAQTAEKAAVEVMMQHPDAGTLRGLAINSRMNSFGFDSVFDPERYQFSMSWYMSKTPGIYEVSLYTPRKDIDLSKIAVEMGGGGHAGACGFQCAGVKFSGWKGMTQGGPPRYLLSFDKKPEEVKELEPLPQVDPTVEPEWQVREWLAP